MCVMCVCVCTCVRIIYDVGETRHDPLVSRARSFFRNIPGRLAGTLLPFPSSVVVRYPADSRGFPNARETSATRFELTVSRKVALRAARTYAPPMTIEREPKRCTRRTCACTWHVARGARMRMPRVRRREKKKKHENRSPVAHSIKFLCRSNTFSITII